MDDRKVCCVERLRWGRKAAPFHSLPQSTWRSTELIPSSHYRVYTDAIFFSHFVRIKIFSHERQIWLKYTFGLGWWMPARLCRGVWVCMLRWYWKGMWAVFRLCSWHVPSLLLLRWSPLSSGTTAGSAALFRQPEIWRGSENEMRKKTPKLSNYFKSCKVVFCD